VQAAVRASVTGHARVLFSSVVLRARVRVTIPICTPVAARGTQNRALSLAKHQSDCLRSRFFVEPYCTHSRVFVVRPVCSGMKRLSSLALAESLELSDARRVDTIIFNPRRWGAMCRVSHRSSGGPSDVLHAGAIIAAGLRSTGTAPSVCSASRAARSPQRIAARTRSSSRSSS
jgi:hypothetical protein